MQYCKYVAWYSFGLWCKKNKVQTLIGCLSLISHKDFHFLCLVSQIFAVWVTTQRAKGILETFDLCQNSL